MVVMGIGCPKIGNCSTDTQWYQMLSSRFECV